MRNVMIAVLCFSFFACYNNAENYNAYVIFAQDSRQDSDMINGITIRLPLHNQPILAGIMCEDDRTGAFAVVIDDDYHLRIREPNGRERTIEAPDTGVPVGIPTHWSNGKARHCGLTPNSPIGSQAQVRWGDINLYILKTGPQSVLYRVGDEGFTLSYPLSRSDREFLHAHAIPQEIADLLY